MNALVAIRQNATGLMSPTPAKRNEVAQRLAAAGQPRAPLVSQKAAGARVITTKGTDGASGTVSRVVNQELSRDAFLQLLVLQLQNQDPLDPIGNEQMLAQLAQFSALEQMNTLNDNFNTLAGNIDQLNFISASALLGRTVSGIDMSGQPLSGLVDGVQLDGSVVLLSIDGRPMSMAGVMQINDPNTESGRTQSASSEDEKGV